MNVEEISVKLEVFEGPLDLLLHLIKTLEIDIYDIPIAEITAQYMAYIHSMKTLELDVAGEYIVMAATLMSIKSKLLLPKQEIELAEYDVESEEGVDPRDALVAQLVEYRKFKYAATVLKEKEEERGQYYTKEATNLDQYKEEFQPLDPNQVTMIDLFLAFHTILERKKNQTPKETTISNDHETIEEKMQLIDQRMQSMTENQGLAFDTLFLTYSKGEIVTTFMALLELVKSGKIIAIQKDHYQPIYLYKNNQKIEHRVIE